ncbi:MAG: PilZ domain-containing protein [Parasphingorhabdus sp.]|nr:PilZ domain-containing protein [Parasphingorhabdus sp.]
MREPFDENLGPNSQTSGQPKRELDRDSLFLKAELAFVESGESGEVRVRNLSAGGMMAEAPIRAHRGDRVTLELRNIGRVSGHVAWVAHGRFGVAFDFPINPKFARLPVGQHKIDLPLHLRKLTAKHPKANGA